MVVLTTDPIFFHRSQSINKQGMKATIYGIDCVRTGFNTNNAWGFGGGEGNSYTFPPRPDIELRIGLAVARHPSARETFIAIYKDRKRIFDAVENPTNAKEAQTLLRELLSKPAGDSTNK